MLAKQKPTETPFTSHLGERVLGVHQTWAQGREVALSERFRMVEITYGGSGGPELGEAYWDLPDSFRGTSGMTRVGFRSVMCASE
jgi:hypothetical protein